jgi:cysteinyl-tRNA synthetase
MYASGSKFPLSELGEFHVPDPIGNDIPPEVWEMCVAALSQADDHPPEEVMDLVRQRAAARTNKDWAESDKLREEIATHGWAVQDSKDGSKLVRNS